MTNAKNAYDTAKAKYDALLKYNEQVNYQLVPYREALDTAEANLTAAENAYNDALANLSYTQASNDKTWLKKDQLSQELFADPQFIAGLKQLVKVKLAEATGADCVQVIGSKFVLYLQKKKDSAYADLLK